MIKQEIVSTNLVQDISSLIDEAKANVANYSNKAVRLLYWHIGKRIYQDVLNEKRAGYGNHIIKLLSRELIVHYGRGYSERSLTNMVKCAKVFPDVEILQTVSAKLSWSHFIELVSLKDDTQRKFYLEMCAIGGWGVRELQDKINGMFFERTAISKNPDDLVQKELINLSENKEISTNLVFRDPYMLSFLQLPASYSESDLESAIINDLAAFLQELGDGFCFIERQKRIIIDGDSYHIDLLMFHRGLRRLIAIDLKLGNFKASYKGQMELYLRWLDKYEKKPGEEQPLGLILCSSKKEEHIELLELDKSGIHVAQYLTELPPKEVLELQLQKVIENAKEKFALLNKDIT